MTNGTPGYPPGAVQINVNRRAIQLVSALAAVVIAILLATHNTWPFDTSLPALPAKPSLWQFLLSDQVTLGFVRLAFIMLAVFVIASVPALVAGGRWLKGFGTGGVTADDAADADHLLDKAKQKLDDTTRELEAVKKEREHALGLVQRFVGGP